jgi:hypothetical protein
MSNEEPGKHLEDLIKDMTGKSPEEFLNHMAESKKGSSPEEEGKTINFEEAKERVNKKKAYESASEEFLRDAAMPMLKSLEDPLNKIVGRLAAYYVPNASNPVACATGLMVQAMEERIKGNTGTADAMEHTAKEIVKMVQTTE